MFMIPEQSTAFALYENNQLDFIDNRSFPTSEIERYRKSGSNEYKNIALLRVSYFQVEAKTDIIISHKHIAKLNSIDFYILRGCKSVHDLYNHKMVGILQKNLFNIAALLENYGVPFGRKVQFFFFEF